jgi:hypothetical protein
MKMTMKAAGIYISVICAVGCYSQQATHLAQQTGQQNATPTIQAKTLVDVKEIEKRLGELEARYQEWAKPINEVIQQSSAKVNRDGYTSEDFDRDVKAAREKQLAKYDPYREMETFFNRLCPDYLKATAQEREQIRNAVNNKTGIQAALVGYAEDSGKRIKSTKDVELLRVALAAISIENCARDYRDVLLVLAEIYVAAENVGIDPRPQFKQVADLSSTKEPLGGNTPVSEILSNFHTYAVLKERKARSK